MPEYQLVAFIDELYPGYSLDNIYSVLCCVRGERTRYVMCHDCVQPLHVVGGVRYFLPYPEQWEFSSGVPETQQSMSHIQICSNKSRICFWSFILKRHYDASYQIQTCGIYIVNWLYNTFSTVVLKQRYK